MRDYAEAAEFSIKDVNRDDHTGGLDVKPSEDMTRIQAVCEHQRGLIYVVPAERSWVCSPEHLPAHALAGFFRELVALKNPAVESLMKDWGLYYRQLPAPPDSEPASD